MKLRSLVFIGFVLAFAVSGFGQSVVITSKKVTYKRAKPIADYKKSFVVSYPKVKASTPALSKKIESAISYETNLKIDIREEQTKMQWLEEADFEVVYNRNGILCITLTIEGSGAYPSSTSKTIVVDLKTGLLVKPTAVFINTSALIAKLKKAKSKEMAETITELKKDPENAGADVESLFKESDQYHKVSLQEYLVSDKGLTFKYDYGFPHVALALQPVGEYFFTWAQLKPYIKPRSLLSKMVR